MNNTYRLTRNSPYNAAGSPDLLDVCQRWGYYIEAASEQEAIAQMIERFPSDNADFSCELWRIDYDPRLTFHSEPQEPDVDDSLPDWANCYANEADYWIAEYPEGIH